MSPSSDRFMLLDDGEEHPMTARVEDDRVWIARENLADQLGWVLKPEGFCRGERCVPVPPDQPVVRDDGVDLERFAELIDRPLAVDPAERAGYLGLSMESHRRTWQTGEAPDFTLPDLEGTPHSLSEFRGQKVFLVAYASW